MSDQQTSESLNLRAYLRPVLRRKYLVITIVVVAAAATYFISSSQQRKYTAFTSIYVQEANATSVLSSASGGSSAPTESDIQDVASLVMSSAVAQAVGKQLGLPPGTALSDISVSASTTSDIVSVTANSTNASQAANLANAFVRQFIASRKLSVTKQAARAENTATRVLRNVRKGTSLAAQTARQTILSEIQQYQQIQLNPDAGASQVSPAVAPGVPSSPKPSRDTVFAAVAGLILAIIAAFGLELFDKRLLSVGNVESLFGVPVLATLPLIAAPAPQREHVPVVPPEFTEELRMLRHRVNASARNGLPRTILVTSGLPAEGKSTIVRDIALVCADAGLKVIVVDTDLRRPKQGELLGVSASKGLFHVLTGVSEFAAAVVEVGLVPTSTLPVATDTHGIVNDSASSAFHESTTPVGSLSVLTHGERSRNPGLLLSSPRMRELLDALAEEYEIVLIDTAPVLTVADCLPLLSLVDANLVVARFGQTTRETVTRFTDLVAGLPDVTIDGIIANAVDGRGDDGYGTYAKYGYEY